MSSHVCKGLYQVSAAAQPFNVGPTISAAAAAKSLQSCPTLCNPIDGSPTGSPIPGILQARTLEWVAISFSWVVQDTQVRSLEKEMETHFSIPAWETPRSLVGCNPWGHKESDMTGQLTLSLLL